MSEYKEIIKNISEDLAKNITEKIDTSLSGDSSYSVFGIILYSILSSLFIALITIVSIQLSKYFFYSLINKAFSDLLLSKAKKICYSSEDSFVCFLIGRASLKSNFLSKIFSEYAYKSTLVKNENLYDDIREVIFVEFGNLVFVSMSENETSSTPFVNEIKIIELLNKASRTTKCINSIVLLTEDESLMDDVFQNSAANCIVKISEYLGLNIPLYVFISNVENIKGLTNIVENTNESKLFNIIGYTNDKYSKESIRETDIRKQLDVLKENMLILSTEYLAILSKFESVFNLIKFEEDIDKFFFNCSSSFSRFTRIFATAKRPVFRGLYFTGEFIIDGAPKFLFVSDFCTFLLEKERDLIDLSQTSIKSYRSFKKEMLIAFYAVISSVFLIVSYNYFSSYSNNIEQRHLDTINIISSIRGGALRMTSNQLNSILLNVQKINKEFRSRSGWNFFHMLENIGTDIVDIENKVNYRVFNFIYKEVRKELVYILKIFFEPDKLLRSDIKDISESLKDIEENFIKYNNFVVIHNSIIDQKNSNDKLMSLCLKLYSLRNELSLNPIVNKQYSIDSFDEILIKSEEKNTIASIFISKYLDSCDEATNIEKLNEVNNEFGKFLTEQKLENKLSILSNLEKIIYNIDFKSFKKDLNYELHEPILNRLLEIGYINYRFFEKTKLQISKKIKENYKKIATIKNNLIGDIFVIKNSEILLSDQVKLIMQMFTKLNESDLYKKYLSNFQSGRELFVMNKKYTYVLKNINSLNQILIEYLDYKRELDLKSFFGNIFGDIAHEIVEKQILYQLNSIAEPLDALSDGNPAIISKLLFRFEKEKEVYDLFVDNYINSRSEILKDIVFTFFSSYIEIMHSELFRLNCFYENNNIPESSLFFIRELYNVDSKDDLVEKLKYGYLKLKDYLFNLESILLYSNKFQNKLIYPGAIKKKDMLYQTLVAVNKHEEDADNSKISFFFREIQKMYSLTKEKHLDFLKRITLEKDYISNSYTRIYDNFMGFSRFKRVNEVNELINDLYKFLSTKKNVFPFFKNGKLESDSEDIEYFLSTVKKIKELCITYGNIEDKLVYKNILKNVENIDQIFDIFKKEFLIRLEIQKDHLVSKTRGLKIKIRNELSQEERILDLPADKTIIDFSIMMNSSIQILIEPLLDPNMNFITSSDINILTDKQSLITFKNPAFMSVLFYANLRQSGKNNKLNTDCRFRIPINCETMNYETVSMDETVVSSEVVFNFRVNQKILDLIASINNISLYIISYINNAIIK